MSHKQDVMVRLQAVSVELREIKNTLVKVNALAADIPCVQKLEELAKDTIMTMQAVSKLRGLE